MTVGSLRLDRAVAQSVLTAIQPAGIEAAVKLTECAKIEDEEKRQALELALERARYEEKRARRQFDAVEPENRLVASELEARWNGALARVAEAEARLAAAGKATEPLSEPQKQQLTALSEDLMALWNHSEAPIQLKKRILRTVLTEIIIDNETDLATHYLRLHWVGGVHTELRVERNKAGQHRHSADRSVIDLVSDLSKISPDNDRGYPESAGIQDRSRKDVECVSRGWTSCQAGREIRSLDHREKRSVAGSGTGTDKSGATWRP